jgi:peptide deformylase
MIKPVYVYGSPVLRRVSEEISTSYPKLKEFVADMFETMAHSDGIGLAAPQVGVPIRMFVIDASPLEDEHPDMKDFKRVFINPKIVERSPNEVLYNEGCLSIPSLREDVMRPDSILIEYFDENFQPYQERFDGIAARIIQHEFDHLEGILFTDRVSPIKRQLLKGKLNAISKGKFNAAYRVKLA